jgi:hypothetical protein
MSLSGGGIFMAKNGAKSFSFIVIFDIQVVGMIDVIFIRSESLANCRLVG